MKIRNIAIFILSAALLLAGCQRDNIIPSNPSDGKTEDGGESGGDTPDGSDSSDGLSYVWDSTVIPEITLSFTLSEWNKLLSYFDKNEKTKEYVHCDVTFCKGGDRYVIKDAGARLRGNTSRKRPEKKVGDGTHQTNAARWQHCHWGVNLRKYVKDKEHKIHGISKLNLKWFNGDPTYVREPFCYDLFSRAGVWTMGKAVYCRVWVKVEGDDNPAYYGVYTMIEPYDTKYLERREEQFGSAGGNLWKCCYTSNGPADLKSTNANFGQDDNVNEYTYELKETGADYSTALAQLKDFIAKLNGKGDESFTKWIKEVCDVDLLLKTYAVNVAVGMWDDHWNNGNNYYLYFNSQDKLDYKVYFLPFDYDNTLGTSNTYDPAKQNPVQWGNMGKLMTRLIAIPEFKQIYVDELKRLVESGNSLMDYASATSRVTEWQNRISPYVNNDTGQDCKIEDKPASWSNTSYKLLGTSNNFFTEKIKAISAL